MRFFVLMVAACLVFGSGAASAAGALALGYQPKYPPDFDHFDYVNPTAPKGGSVTLSAPGTFDSLNPYLLRGLSAAGVEELVFETLMTSSLDEPFSQYGLLAEDEEVAPDGHSATFRLNPKARFSDGSPVTADDVKFSFDTLKSDQAHPFFRFYFADVSGAVVTGPRTIRFEFSRVSPELHLIIGQLPVFPRHWIGNRKFSDVVLDKPISSGPYVVESFELGKRLVFRRNPDYWARDLNSRRGMYNFDRVTFRYYRDSTAQLEAFKAGEFDFSEVRNAKQWARDYRGEKFDKGLIKRQLFPHHNDAGMQGFIFNLRRPLFQDKRVRQAINLAFDFEWANHHLFYDQYQRCDSYFSNNELASSGLPEGDELALLEPFRKQLPPELFTEVWRPPSTKLHGLRPNLIKAKALLEAAGWHYRDGALRNAKGEPFRFEFMLGEKDFQRVIAPFARNLAILGIELDYRTVDAALYQRRGDNFDFDMMVATYGESQSPGNELTGKFSSAAADRKRSDNLIGIKNPVVDALVNKVIFAPDRKALVTAVHALDRVLLWGDYLVPNWYMAKHRVAYWSRFGVPHTLPLYYSPTSWMLSTWWSEGQTVGQTSTRHQ